MYQRNSSITKGNDKVMIALYATIILIGLVCIISVEYKSTQNFIQTLFGFKTNYSKQFYFFCACCVVGTFILLTDSKFFTATSNLSYLIGILLIIATFVVGKEISPAAFLVLILVAVNKQQRLRNGKGHTNNGHCNPEHPLHRKAVN